MAKRDATIAHVSGPDWTKQFPDLPHAPQDLDLVRRHLAWTPQQRLENLEQVIAFIARARNSRWLPKRDPKPR